MSEQRTVFRKLFFALLLGVVFVFGVFVGRGDLDDKNASGVGGAVVRSDSIPEYLSRDVSFDLYWELWKRIQAEFVGAPIADTELFYGSLAGMVKSLKDDYSEFFTPQAAQEFDQQFEGEFEGIGAEIGIKNEHLVIISPLPETPAERAGLKPGDWILSIDGVSSDEYSLDEAVRHIRGKKGSVVKLEIVQGRNESKVFEVTRDKIVIKEVKVSYQNTLSGRRVARVHLVSFNNKAFSGLQEIARELALKGVEGIVFDLRNNPGGLIDQSVAVASLWVPKGKVVVTESADEPQGKDSREVSAFVSDGNGLFAQVPTVVLINKGSASASEIVAGALQDYGLASVVGETSFGKGSVQAYSKFSDGSGVKITVAKWFTPLNRGIDKAGIKPDVEVPLTEEDFAADRDPQLEKALEILDEKISK